MIISEPTLILFACQMRKSPCIDVQHINLNNFFLSLITDRVNNKQITRVILNGIR